MRKETLKKIKKYDWYVTFANKINLAIKFFRKYTNRNNHLVYTNRIVALFSNRTTDEMSNGVIY